MNPKQNPGKPAGKKIKERKKHKETAKNIKSPALRIGGFVCPRRKFRFKKFEVACNAGLFDERSSASNSEEAWAETNIMAADLLDRKLNYTAIICEHTENACTADYVRRVCSADFQALFQRVLSSSKDCKLERWSSLLRLMNQMYTKPGYILPFP